MNKKSKVPITRIKKNAFKIQPIQEIHEGRWPHKYIMWSIDRDSDDFKIYGLMAVKILSIRDVKTNKINLKWICDYKSDEGYFGKRKEVFEMRSKEANKVVSWISIEMAEKFLESMIRKIKKEYNFSEPDISDFSNCKSLDECIEKLENHGKFICMPTDEIPGNPTGEIRG